MSERVEVLEIPNCDLCPTIPGTPAKYDGKMKGRSSWAYMCQKHWDSDGIGELGTGRGQELVLKETKSD